MAQLIYTIQPGYFLRSPAYGNNVKDIVDLNNIANPDMIYPDQLF